MEILAARDSRDAEQQRKLLISYASMGLLAKAREEWAEARDWLVKSTAVADRLFADSNAAEATALRIAVLRQLAECQRTLGEAAAASR